MTKRRPVLADARSWARQNRLSGPHAFLRYIIFRFTENLNQVSDEFVFKGGNLLWVYIATPRATVDLDLSTLKINSHVKVRNLIEKAGRASNDIEYTIHSFQEIDRDGRIGAAVSLAYRTEQGASNRFEIDLLYALRTESHYIDSPVHPHIKLRTATTENIIADKLAACQRFGAGNTRLKDFDDLWRLSQSLLQIDKERLRNLLKTRNIDASLEPDWINSEMERAWHTHQKRYKDLPKNLKTLFGEVNQWLNLLEQKRTKKS